MPAGKRLSGLFFVPVPNHTIKYLLNGLAIIIPFPTFAPKSN